MNEQGNPTFVGLIMVETSIVSAAWVPLEVDREHSIFGDEHQQVAKRVGVSVVDSTLGQSCNVYARSLGHPGLEMSTPKRHFVKVQHR